MQEDTIKIQNEELVPSKIEKFEKQGESGYSIEIINGYRKFTGNLFKINSSTEIKPRKYLYLL